MVYFLCKASDSGRQNCYFALSLPVRGVWVEIKTCIVSAANQSRSLPVRGVWVEILLAAVISSAFPSLPVRGVWVEIC